MAKIIPRTRRGEPRLNLKMDPYNRPSQSLNQTPVIAEREHKGPARSDAGRPLGAASTTKKGVEIFGASNRRVGFRRFRS